MGGGIIVLYIVLSIFNFEISTLVLYWMCACVLLFILLYVIKFEVSKRVLLFFTFLGTISLESYCTNVFLTNIIESKICFSSQFLTYVVSVNICIAVSFVIMKASQRIIKIIGND